MRVHACAYSLTTEQTCSLARQHASHHGVVVVAIAAVAICEMGERMKGVERGEKENAFGKQPTNISNNDLHFFKEYQMYRFTYIETK
jgi:hypothetical protein